MIQVDEYCAQLEGGHVPDPERCRHALALRGKVMGIIAPVKLADAGRRSFKLRCLECA